MYIFLVKRQCANFIFFSKFNGFSLSHCNTRALRVWEVVRPSVRPPVRPPVGPPLVDSSVCMSWEE